MKISVIIPTYQEEEIIENTLRSLRAQDESLEVLVVDGGSTDRTKSIASRFSCVLDFGKGRAAQMNRGAEVATGDVFFFLHADTTVPEGGLGKIREAIDMGAEAGRFRMRFDENGKWLRLFSTYTKYHWFSYGDQGFFVTREMFELLGGFRTKTPFEDIDFYRRLQKRTKPVILSDAVTTSARRFLYNGCLKQKLINLVLTGLYRAGIDVTFFKQRLYPDIR